MIKRWFATLSAVWLLQPALPLHAAEQCTSLLDFEVKTLVDEQPVRLCDAYQGQVILVVNTASKCAFTGQYEGLESLYRTYKDQGLVVLGFPSNDFGGQEPGSAEQIQAFCRNTYSVEFPMFSKTSVLGEQADPFWKQLIAESGVRPKWNFYKYLIDRNGQLVDVFSSVTSPESDRFQQAITQLLVKP